MKRNKWQRKVVVGLNSWVCHSYFRQIIQSIQRLFIIIQACITLLSLLVKMLDGILEFVYRWQNQTQPAILSSDGILQYLVQYVVVDNHV